VQHQSKAFSLHFNREFRELKADPDEMASFVLDVRAKLAELHNVPLDRIIIMSVRDGTTVAEYAVDGDCTRNPTEAEYRQYFGPMFKECYIHPSFVQMQIRPSTFAPEWNRDYTIASNCPVGEKRGGFDYTPPAGWQRYGMNVAGKFADGEAWLGMSNQPGEWCVAYHGTPSQNVASLTKDTPPAGYRSLHAHGIYCSPDPAIAAQSARQVGTGEKRFSYMFMCRVNPLSICHCPKAPCPYEHDRRFTMHITTSKDIWFMNAHNEGSRCIRPYGILVKEI
jgi:hypothetical protein